MRTMFAAIAAAMLAATAAGGASVEPPKPYGPTPTERQVKWQVLEMYAFIHFGVDTFTDQEWGYGDEKESVFNPTAFDADQIARTVKAAGLKGLILTVKHHDGFCLWPSKFTTHSVKNSPWKGGRGDVVKEMAEACKRQGILFGIYLSPWDRNHPEYGRPGYVAYYKNQIRELLTNYGPIFEVWFDGANGGDGWYGGTKERRNISGNYYDWPGVISIIRQLQPGCVVWGADADINGKRHYADVRWGGSEKGDVGDPCWATMSTKLLGLDNGCHAGVRNGDTWCPPEGDATIRNGWFYHASEDNRVKSPQKLMDIYFSCVGRGANLILNVPPDRRGVIHENDVKALQGFRKLMDETFGADLARSAVAMASNVRGNDPKFGAQNLLDGSRETYWASNDDVATPEVTLSFKEPVTFNVVRIREAIRLGQRVDDWAVDAWLDGAWKEIAKGTAIGACRLARTETVTTDKVRLRITKSPVCPAIAELGLFLEKSRGAGGPEKMNDGISKAKWKVAAVSFDGTGHNGAGAIDGKPDTWWHTKGADGERQPPQEIAVDMGEAVNVKGFTCLPRQDGFSHGTVDKYEFYLSADGKTWAKAAEGEFANVRANPILQAVKLAKPATARYFKFVGTHVVERNHVVVAELGILGDSAK